MIGVPAARGILLLFHPRGAGDFSEIIDGNVTAWITVHLGMGIFVPLFAAVVYLLLRGVKSTAATISRMGLAVFASLYAGREATFGVAGLSVDRRCQRPGPPRSSWRSPEPSNRPAMRPPPVRLDRGPPRHRIISERRRRIAFG
jgi:hypothetical protein